MATCPECHTVKDRSRPIGVDQDWQPDEPVLTAIERGYAPLSSAFDPVTGDPVPLVVWMLADLRAAVDAVDAIEWDGTATRGEQYAGWAALPSPDEPDAARGRQLIDRLGGRAAALRATHPDTRDPRSGLTDRDFADVQAARGA